MSHKCYISRRGFLKADGAGLFLTGLHITLLLPVWALTAAKGVPRKGHKNRYDLTIGYSPIEIDGRQGRSTGINGTVPINCLSSIPFSANQARCYLC